MNESKTQALSKVLNEDEQVVGMVENHRSNQFQLLVKMISGVLYLGMICSYFIGNFILCIISVGLLILGSSTQWKLLAYLSERLSFLQKKGMTILTDQRAILPSKKSVYWKHVYNVKSQVSGADTFVVLDLRPYKVEYDLHDDYLYNVIEKDEFIFLGGKYDATALIDKITPHWIKESPVANLEAAGKHLKDKYNFRTTRRQNNLELLTLKKEEFTINYTHKNRFPVNKFEVTVHFKEPIAAFLTIGMEGVSSQLKQAIGFQDIQIGHSSLDSRLFIQGSDVQWTKNLFSNELIEQLERALRIGAFQLSFGKAENQLKLKSKSTTKVDSEEILDLQLVNKNEEENTIELKGHKVLTLSVLSNEKSGVSSKSVSQIADDLMDLTFHFANGLNTLKE